MRFLTGLCYETLARANPTVAVIVVLVICMSQHPFACEVSALYERHALAWDGDRVKSLFERAWLDRFKATIAPGNTVLDFGCGAGEPIARYLIENGYRVTGIDSSPALIGLCQQRFPTETWIAGDMRRVQLAGQFGGIIAWDSFFHLTANDQRRMFAIFDAQAARDAVLMFTSGPCAGERIGSYRGEPLYHASLDPVDYEALLSAHSFGIVAYKPEDPECGGRTVWLAQRNG